MKFADDTKVGNRVSTAEERENLQMCLDMLTNWATTQKSARYCMWDGPTPYRTTQ